MALYDFTVYNVVRRNARCFPERPAWLEVSDGREITFGRFKDMVDHLAKGLQDEGLKKGDRIGILGKNSLEYFLLYGAASALGLIVIAINWRLSADEVENNLVDGAPRLVFADPEFQGLIEQLKAKLTSVEKYYNLSEKQGSFEDFNRLLDNDADFEMEDVATDDGIVIIHTAAVEGKPRGAIVTHRNLLSATTQFGYLFNVHEKDVHLNILPLFHVGGLFIAATAFHAGAVNINVSKFDADQAVDLIQEKKVTMLFDFAPILASILDSQKKMGKDIKTLRMVAGLDSPETIERYQRETGGDFFVVYGQTEVSALVTISPYNEKPGSAGRPLPLADVRLFDDYDKEVEVGQIGEIVVRGPMVFKGYWNLPEETAYTFREGWHHTGDQGRFDEDGFLWYAGRKAEKELIKPGGENVYPAEVEKVILENPAVVRTVVFGVPDPKWKEAIKAVCELKEGSSLQPQELIDFVGERIARYKKPQYVEFVKDLPLLDDGSIDRLKVKEMYGGEG
ncbi:MAG: AMP-binding protein [Deltaproteobacteria bacterium]|nr:AMP-binding protein [Deltaproteobacteria bacterium]